MLQERQSADAVMEELERILASRGFARSPSLRRFLRYTVDLTINGRQDEIKEYLIGTEVFHRGHAFDPKTDTIVRTQAHRLRGALAAYYEAEGQADPIVVEYAKGAYVPVFRTRGSIDPAVPGTPPSLVHAEAVPVARTKFNWAAIAVTGAALVLLAAVIFWPRTGSHPLPPAALLSFKLSEQGSLDFDRGPLVLSPSGRFAVFPFIENTGARRLWIRSLKSSAPRPLEGTNDGALPFWSPDETRIGFFAGNMLKVYRLADGLVNEIAEAPTGRGGTWNRDDVILFARQSSGLIFRVAASGGPAVPVTALNTALEENDHRWPEFLPDGRHFLFSARSRRKENGGIYLSLLDGGSPVRLSAVDSQAHSVAVDGGHFMLYDDDASIKVRRLDLKSGRLFGPETTLVEGVRYSLSSGSAFSVAGEDYLAFHSFTAEKTEVQKYDRAGRLLQRLTEPGIYKGINLSIDGLKLAIDTMIDPRSGDEIWVTASNHPSPRRFTFSSAGFPVWARDGRSVFYVDFSQGLPVLRHKSLNEDGSGTLVSKPDHPVFPTDTSPDGKFLVYHEDNPHSLMDIYVLPLDPATGNATGKPLVVRRTPFEEKDAFFSPDGGHLAYVSNESRHQEVYVQELAPEHPQDSRRWKVSSNGGSHPRWRHDGKELFYLSPEKSLMSVSVRWMPDGLAFGTPVKLFGTLAFSGADSKSPYGVAPDGQSFYFNVTRVDPAVPVVNVLASWPSLVPAK